MSDFYNKLEEKLKRKEEVFDLNLKCFCSNDYLNLSKHLLVKKASREEIKINGVGACGSKFVNGYSVFYKLIEDKIKAIKSSEDALIFTSGYTANIGIFESLASNQDIVFLDEESHASTFAGIKISDAKFIRFKHNDVVNLNHKLKKYSNNKRRIFIATETIFSMSGDLLLKHDEYIKLAKQYNAILITDEAHSFGIINFEFKKYNLHLRMGTFSKAVGVLGGFVAGNFEIIEEVRQFAKSGIYTTALPSSILAAVLKSLELIESGKVNANKALQNAKIFDSKLQTQIAFIKCENSLRLEHFLKERGFFVKAIRRPTVKNEGVRITFNNSQKKIDIKKLRFIINQFFENI